MMHGHGDDIYKYRQGKMINFSSNVYSHIDQSGLREHLTISLPLITSYPEPDGESLVKVIAQNNGIKKTEIVVTNGATEAIYLIARTFSQKRSVILSPTFAEYKDACALAYHKTKEIESLGQISKNDEIIWICNPNNPTGSSIDAQDLVKLATNMPEKLFVIDQSYSNLTQTSPLTHKIATSLNNVIIIQSLTKKFAIPGLRIGYIVTNSYFTGIIKHFCMPWSVNVLAIEAAKYLLKLDEVGYSVRDLLEETGRFRLEMESIDGITTIPTKTNFFLCRTEYGDASMLKEWLANEKGMLIRDASNFMGLDKGYFRVATQLPEENKRLISAIKCWIKLYI